VQFIRMSQGSYEFRIWKSSVASIFTTNPSRLFWTRKFNLAKLPEHYSHNSHVKNNYPKYFQGAVIASLSSMSQFTRQTDCSRQPGLDYPATQRYAHLTAGES
jgi:hypothetical protein